MGTTKRQRYIYRFEGASGRRGWQVRVQRVNGKLSRYFSDSLFGSKAASLRAAIDYRDFVLRDADAE